MKKIFVYDSETNGLPKQPNGNAEDLENWPRLSQLSYGIYSEDGVCLKFVNEYIFPDGWDFPSNDFFREHADINKNKELGKPVKDLLIQFIEDRMQCDFTVGHNLYFDGMILRSEMFRAQLKPEFKSKKFCTMMKSTKFCNLPPTEKMIKANFNRPKPPNLNELHNCLFGSSFEGAHNSKDDVTATAKCFFELVKRGVIILS